MTEKQNSKVTLAVLNAVINSKLDTIIEDNKEQRKERKELCEKIDNLSSRLTVVETTQQTCYARNNYTEDKKNSNAAMRSWVQFVPGVVALVITIILSVINILT